MPDVEKPNGQSSVLPSATWGLKWDVFTEVFWRDVIYAILPLIVSFIITVLRTPYWDKMKELLWSAEWLFAAIVFLGLSIAQIDQRREAGMNKVPGGKRLQTQPLLFLVIVAALLLGLSLYQRQAETSEIGGNSHGSVILAVTQLVISFYALYRLWKLALQQKLAEARWEDALNSNPPQLPKDMSPTELISNIRRNLRVAREQMALLGRAVSAEKQVAQIAARNPEAWDTAATDLQAEVRGFINLSEMLERSLSNAGTPATSTVHPNSPVTVVPALQLAEPAAFTT